MLDILPLVVGQMQANCYLITDPTSKKTIIVDPGDAADYISRIISDHQVTPEKIIATHGHFDHIMGALELKLAYNIPFLVHKADEFLVKNMESSARHFIGIATGPPPPIDGFIDPSHPLKLGNHTIKILHVPGHTPGSTCLYLEKEHILITGDTLFAGGGVGRTDFSYSRPLDLVDSLRKLFTLPPETKILPGHGQSSTLEKERVYHHQI